MTTSLSRQLEQLRTPATNAASAGEISKAAFSSGPFLIRQSDLLDERQLEILASDAFKELSEQSCDLVQFKAVLFDGEEMQDEEAFEESWQGELLPLLTPFVLSKSGQFLLQWLVSKHKVHISHAEELFWCCLPFYSYQIFHKVVEAISVLPSVKYPRWFSAFKAACHPATKIGMTRLVARDQGFLKLLCDRVMKTKGHQGRHPASNYDDVLHFFCTVVLSAVKVCGGEISEGQMKLLTQIMVSCLKSGHDEFFALGGILLAKLVPLVYLRAKQANRMVNVLSKCCAKTGCNESTLSMVLVTFRSQREVIDHEAVIRLLSKHSDDIRRLMDQVDKDNDDLVFLSRMMYCFALLWQHVTNTFNIDNEVVSLLSFIERGLSAIDVGHNTAVLLICNVSKSLLQFKTMKRSNPEKKDIIKGLSSKCREVLGILKRSYPEEYIQNSLVQTEDVDIIFLVGSSGDTMPTHEEIVVKRILLDNPLVAVIQKELMFGLKRGSEIKPGIDMKKILKDNRGAAKTIYTTVSHDFLFAQLELHQLLTMTFNLMWLFQKRVTILDALIKFVCSEKVAGSQSVMDWCKERGIDLALLILETLVRDNDDDVRTIVDCYNQTWFQENVGLLENLDLNGVTTASDLWSRIEKALSGETLLRVTEELLSLSELHRTSSLVTLLLAQFGRECKHSIGKTLPLERTASLVLKLLDTVYRKFEVIGNREGDDLRSFLLARKSMKVPVDTLTWSVDALFSGSREFEWETLTEYLNLACRMTKKHEAFATKLKNLHDSALGNSDESEHYFRKLLMTAVREEGAHRKATLKPKVTSLMKSYAVEKLVAVMRTKSEARKRFVSHRSLLCPTILTVLTSQGNRRAKKLCFGALSAVVDGAKASSKNYVTLLAHLLACQSELLSSVDNIERIMQDPAAPAGMIAILRSLFSTAQKDSPALFSGISVFLTPLSTQSDAANFAHYGSELLGAIEGNSETTNTEAGRALSILLEKFFPKIILPHIQNSSCWHFFRRLVQSNREIVHKNMRQKICLATLRETSGLTTNNDKFGPQLFALLVSVGSDCEDSDVLLACRNVIRMLDLKAQAFEETVRPLCLRPPASATRRKRRHSEHVESNSLDKADDLKSKWKRINFVLEMFLEKKLEKCESLLRLFFELLRELCGLECEDSYSIDLVLSCILHSVESVSSEERTVSRLDVTPEVLVRCIHSCSNPDTKSTALMVLAKSTYSLAAEYLLQNSISIFTFMGDHFLRVDSQSSFDVACQAIDIIIPQMQQRVGNSKEKGQSLHDVNLQIVTTFVDASLDMPQHRFKTFFYKLIMHLGEKEYLWITIAFLLRTVDRQRSGMDGVSRVKKSQRLDRIIDLFLEFTPVVQVEAFLHMLVKVKEDSSDLRRQLKMKEDDVGGKDFASLHRNVLFFIKVTMTKTKFYSRFCAAVSDDSILLILTTKLVKASINSLEASKKEPSKEKRILVSSNEEILERSLAILPPAAFVSVLCQLLSSTQENDVVRVKAMALLHARLTRQVSQLMNEESLVNLVDPIFDIARMSGSTAAPTCRTSDQVLSLMILGSLARSLASKHSEKFLKLCGKLLNEGFVSSLSSPQTKAAFLIAVVDSLIALHPEAVILLPRFVPFVLNTMNTVEFGESERETNLLGSLILTVKRLMENFSDFLSPYVKDFVTATCTLIAKARSGLDDAHSRQVSQRMKSLQEAVASGATTNAMISHGGDCYDGLRSTPAAVKALADIFKDNLSKLNQAQAVAASPSFMQMALHWLTFRKVSGEDVEVINEVEQSLIEAFLSLTLKLSLNDFKPLLYRVLNQPLFSSAGLDIATGTTVFHVTYQVAKRLGTLFSFVCETLIHKTTTLLTQCASDNFSALRGYPEEAVVAFLSFLLDALSNVFKNTAVESLQVKSYEDHVNALLAFVSYSFRNNQQRTVFFEKMTDCLAELASSTEDETQWKYLNYQVLLSLRSPDPQVRSFLLDVISRFVDVKGENYMSVLPEAVPFLGEMLDDEEPNLEKACKELFAKMEEAFGQSIESYFE